MKMDMILFLGQSNMQGQTETLTENEPVDGAFEYRLLEDECTTLKNPVGENIKVDYSKGFDVDINDLQNWLETHLTGSAVDGNTNLVPSFCRAYISETGRQVVAVHIAKGSTEVEYWSPNHEGYHIIVKKAEGAIKKIGPEHIGRIYCVWLQGESDAVASTPKETYKLRLTLLKNDLKSRFCIDKFCIIKVGAFTCDERDQVIFDAQEELCKQDSDFVMLTRITEQLITKKEYLNPYASGHYSAIGQELLGKEAGHSLALLTKEV